MATWVELSLDCFAAATELVSGARFRSGVSRAYYAAYSAVSGVMAKQDAAFPRGWKNPAHDQLIGWLASQKSWSRARRRVLVKTLRRLRRGREDADYRPGASLAKADAIRFLKDAALILNTLKIRK